MIDYRPNIQATAYKGVQLVGSSRIHAISTETVWRRLAHCGVALQAACPASIAPVNCPGCLTELRASGYSG